MHKTYDTILDVHGPLYCDKHNLGLKLAHNDNNHKFVIGNKVKIVQPGNRKKNNGQCGYVSGIIPQLLYIVLHRARVKPQVTIKKMRKIVAHVIDIEDVSIKNFFLASSNDSGESCCIPYQVDKCTMMLAVDKL